ncbi:type VI secretion system spike protein VgrG1b [Niveibacterium umoris]|uniref:Type VI secretion system secreted protein VgrG n=1 Tax=Niveibacterium umoris TaxID=1193620 RepID=A0A840BHD1_9RHOO|nr:type VI secretion system tip protein TssI/VgrG [Niveibacterium umoris]MBB4011654.1 type VI secretion system secreted protein VgrG [Niveibacterium umoris]
MQLASLVKIVSPLGGDLLFRSMHGQEEVSRLYEYKVTVLSPKDQIELNDLIGKTVSVQVALENEKIREFNGFVTAMAQTGIEGRYHRYQLTVRPWAWLMSRTADCKIFQQKSVPDIIKAVFADHAVADVKFSLSESYSPREYCVQYRESDLGFVCRLMEQEGIYFYFKHKDGRHTMVVTDSYAGHSASPGFESIDFVPDSVRGIETRSGLREWRLSREIQASKYALTDFDFTKPGSNLLATKAGTVPGKHAQADHEVFDYPGEYEVRSEGERLARVRIEELRHQFELCRGNGNVRGLACGALFKLTDHPRADQNREYLILSASYTIEHGGHETGSGSGDVFEVSIETIPSRQPFHPVRATPKPFVQGPQTAIVVGPSGDEIYTDKYGRVKVKFHWDRYADGHENSSCWIRVSHPWAGKNWGMVAIPRIGQEVIVEFLEGDPDRPIITGRVYNADQMPPYDLPANMTQTGIKTRSTKGGGPANFNELRFEDKKGSEQVYLHAEKDQAIEVEHDETHWVGHDRAKTIDHDEIVHVKHDRTEQVDNNESITIGVNQTETIGNNRIVSVGTNHSETIGSAMSIVVGTSLTESVGVNYAETVGGAMELTVGAALLITVGAAMAEVVGAAKSETVGGSKSESVGSNRTVTVGADMTESVGGGMSVSVSKDAKQAIGGKQMVEVAKEATLQAKKVQITADDEISFKTGSAEIIMKKNGDITIKGGKITVKGSGDVVLKGSKVTAN